MIAKLRTFLRALFAVIFGRRHRLPAPLPAPSPAASALYLGAGEIYTNAEGQRAYRAIPGGPTYAPGGVVGPRELLYITTGKIDR